MMELHLIYFFYLHLYQYLHLYLLVHPIRNPCEAIAAGIAEERASEGVGRLFYRIWPTDFGRG